jgi:hypothetical protein
MCRFMVICLAFVVCIATESIAADPSLEGVEMQDAFAPGPGKAVGRISRVAGQVALIHKDETMGYWAVEGLDLFENDTVITLSGAHAAFRLADGSFVTLSPESKMVIAKSVYAPEKTTRTTFIDMIKGKSRFVVKPFVEARRSEFKVKTATSVAGVRGSDFIITASESVTEITTLADTHLEVASVTALDASPVMLKDFEQIRVALGMPPGAVRKIQTDEVDRLMREFRFRPEPGDVTSVTGKWPVDQLTKEGAVSPGGLVVDWKDLINPDVERFREGSARLPLLSNDFKSRTLLISEQEIRDKQDMIFQQQFEDMKYQELPDFPGTP